MTYHSGTPLSRQDSRIKTNRASVSEPTNQTQPVNMAHSITPPLDPCRARPHPYQTHYLPLSLRCAYSIPTNKKQLNVHQLILMQTDQVSKKSTAKNQILKFNLSQTKGGMICNFLFSPPFLVSVGLSMQQKSK